MSGNRIVFETALDGTGFERGLARLGHTGAHGLKHFVLGAFGVYSVHQALHKTVETAEELVTASKRLDTTVEQLQVLRQAAKENQVEFGKLAGAFEKINLARAKALSGGKEGTKLLSQFKQLGVTEEMLRSKTAADLFTGPLAEKIRHSNVADIAAPLKAVLGKGFGQLIPVMKTDFEELEQKMKSLGSIMDTETAVALKHVKDEFDLLSNIIVAQLAPQLVNLADWLFKAVGEIKAFAAWLGSLSGSTSVSEMVQDAAVAPYHERNLESDPDTVDPEDRKDAKIFFKRVKRYLRGASAAAEEVTAEWQKKMDEMRKHLKEQADLLKHPKPPELDFEAKAEKQAKEKHQRAPASDSLVAVGNFLGSSKAMMETLAQRQVDLLTRIEVNTRPTKGLVNADTAFYPVA